MSYFTVGYRLPNFLSASLFGDRKRFGLNVQPDDPCWKEWQNTYLDFYYANQKESIGKIVNDAGYNVMSKLNLEGKKILEIGPGDINHINNWKGRPSSYVIADVKQEMLDRTSAKLKKYNISHSTRLLVEGDFGNLPFEDEEFDALISFYAFEHLYPFPEYLQNMMRVLKKKGKIVGAIPGEGGLAWGMGRLVTSRRWLKKNTTINPDKIICWEHPNFAGTILKTLDARMKRCYLSFWPLSIHVIDLNLVIKFIYEKI
jgi:SAM-dependent methyltransferase